MNAWRTDSVVIINRNSTYVLSRIRLRVVITPQVCPEPLCFDGTDEPTIWTRASFAVHIETTVAAFQTNATTDYPIPTYR